MTMRELPWLAAQRLGLTTRRIRLRVARLREHGPAGLGSRHRPNPATAVWTRQSRIGRGRSFVIDRSTLACEKPWECHGTRLAKEPISKLMTDGLWIPCRQQTLKVSQPRARWACLDELVQIDGSDYRWLDDWF